MKILTWYEPPAQEIEVELGIEEITRALCQESESPTAAFRLLCSAYQSMRAIPDDIIDGMTTTQRESIVKGFGEQISRFHHENDQVEARPDGGPNT